MYGLKHNLLSINQLWNANKKAIFESSMCKIIDGETNEVLFYGNRKNNIYISNTVDLDNSKIKCL